MRTRGQLYLGSSRLSYEEAGDGPPVVLIHAGVADSRMWDPQMDALAARHRVVRYDSRGYGESSGSAEDFAEYRDLAALMSRLEMPRASLIGASRGAKIALEFALGFPVRVERLVLVGPGLPGIPKAEDATMLQLWDEQRALFTAGAFDRLVELDLQTWLDGPLAPPGRVGPPIRDFVRDMSRRVYETARAISNVRSISLEPPVATRLGEIAAETLVIVGSLDESGVREASELIASCVPGASLSVITGVAHLPNLEVPDRFNRLVLAFLDKPRRRVPA